MKGEFYRYRYEEIDEALSGLELDERGAAHILMSKMFARGRPIEGDIKSVRGLLGSISPVRAQRILDALIAKHVIVKSIVDGTIMSPYIQAEIENRNRSRKSHKESADTRWAGVSPGKEQGVKWQ